MEQALQNLMSPNNATRNKTESMMTNEIRQNPNCVVSGLVQTLRNCEKVALRSMAAVLLRRYLLDEKFRLWSKANDGTKNALKNALLQALANETQRVVWTKLCDTISDLAIGTNFNWPELFPFVIKCASGNSNAHIEAALRVLAPMSLHIAENMKNDLVSFRNLLASCLGRNDARVKAAAVKTVAQLIVLLRSEQERSLFNDLTTAIINSVGLLAKVDRCDLAADAMDAIIDLADSDFMITGLKPRLSIILQLCTTIVQTSTLEDRLRHLAVELLVTCSERAPTAVRAMNPKDVYCSKVLPAILGLMTELEDADDETWTQQRDERDSKMDSTHLGVGMQAWLRIGTAIRRKRFAPVALSLVASVMSSEKRWTALHAVLLALSQISECLPEDPKVHVKLTEHVVRFFRHPHPRVRYVRVREIFQNHIPTSTRSRNTTGTLCGNTLSHHILSGSRSESSAKHTSSRDSQHSEFDSFRVRASSCSSSRCGIFEYVC